MVRRRVDKRFSPFYFARFTAGFLRVDRCQELLGVSARTIRNWDQRGAPRHVMTLFALLNGDLGAIYPEWHGWHLRQDAILGPGKLRVTLEQLREHPHQTELLGHSLAQLNMLHRWGVYRLFHRFSPFYVPGRPKSKDAEE